MGDADLLRGFWLGQTRALFQTHAIITQEGLQPVTHLSGALDRLAVNVQEVAPLLRLEIRHPNSSGRQIRRQAVE